MIRALPQLARTPVLILSARTEPRDIEVAFAVGAEDYVTKPFRGAVLDQHIRWLLSPHPGLAS